MYVILLFIERLLTVLFAKELIDTSFSRFNRRAHASLLRGSCVAWLSEEPGPRNGRQLIHWMFIYHNVVYFIPGSWI